MLSSGGIYSITNTISGKRYIGQTNNFARRKAQHFSYLRNGSHHNILLQRAFSKYGEEFFEFEVLEEVSEIGRITEREQHWMDYYDTFANGYNLAPAAGSTLGFKHSEEFGRAVSERQKLYWQSAERREWASEKWKRYYGDNPEVCEQISESLRKYHEDNPDAAARHSEVMKDISNRPDKLYEFSLRMRKWWDSLSEDQKSDFARSRSVKKTDAQKKLFVEKSRRTRLRRSVEGTSSASNICWVEQTSRKGSRLLLAFCYWTDLEGKRITKAFSALKYGIMEAWAMACQYRDDNIKIYYLNLDNKGRNCD